MQIVIAFVVGIVFAAIFNAILFCKTFLPLSVRQCLIQK